MYFRQVTDPHLAQNAYVLGCQASGEALVIDPERDVDRYVAAAARDGLRLVAAAETHIHADFLSGSRQLAARGVERVYLSDLGGEDWRYRWTAGVSCDVRRLRDGDTFRVGGVEIRAVHTPGHTPEHLCFLVTDRGAGASQPMGIVSGDFVFVGDVGRPDLLETAVGERGAMRPAARTLFRSLPRFLELPDHLQVWPAHGAGSACGKALGAVPTSTVGYERRFNAALLAASEGEDAFVDYVLAGQVEPPPYFARMKRWNRDGVPLLDELPRPERLPVSELLRAAARTGGVVVDARRERREFMAAHLPGSLYAASGPGFPTVVGSYVGDEPIFLVAHPGDVDGIVRDLVRVGLDDVLGYADARTLAADEVRARTRSTPVVTMVELDALRRRDDHVTVDVRSAAEYRERHVPAALNVPHTQLAGRLDEIPRDRTLLVHCGTGKRAASAAALLERAGRNVVVVDDRLENWSAAED
jgi:hydroxyacylglutathione hydrolase